MELVSGVYAFPQTVDRNGMQITINPAAVDTPHGLLLCDTGFPDAVHQIAEHLDSHGFVWSDIAGVLLTHQDGDHAGAVAELVERSGAMVFAHQACAPYVDGRREPVKSPDGERYPATDVDVTFEDGITIRTNAGPMEVMYTPGHTAGHVSLYLPEEALLIAADALTADENGLQGPSEEFTLEMDEALDSAEALASLDIEHILCYHGGYVKADGNEVREVVQAMR